MSNLLELYQKYCTYQITDHIQELELTFDIERLRQELFEFIIDNKFGFSTVSLRLPPGRNDYTSKEEMLETGAINPNNFYKEYINVPINVTHNKLYTNWHPDLANSYLSSLVPEIEKICGLNIGRIRLGWLQSNIGYDMHNDLEPMRLHIPLFTNNLAYFIHDHKINKMAYGKLYHLITTDIHTAWNYGHLPRLHLIFSTYIDDIVDSEIAKLKNFDITSQNFINTIKDHGVDRYSLMKIFHITNTTNKLNGELKVELLQEIKNITNILSEI